MRKEHFWGSPAHSSETKWSECVEVEEEPPKERAFAVRRKRSKRARDDAGRTKEVEMTERQRELAEQKHDLIYIFMRKYRIDPEEYYDALAIAYCECIMAWREEKVREGTIEGFVIHGMSMRWKNIKRMERQDMRKANYGCIRLDAPLGEDGGLALRDLLTDEESAPKEESERLHELLTKSRKILKREKDRSLLEKMAEGKSVREIAEEWGVSRQCVYNRLKRVREMILRASGKAA